MTGTFAKVLLHLQVVLLESIVVILLISVHRVIFVHLQVIYLFHVLLVLTVMQPELKPQPMTVRFALKAFTAGKDRSPRTRMHVQIDSIAMKAQAIHMKLKMTN